MLNSFAMGVLIAGSTGNIERSLVSGVVPDAASGEFGDGIAVISYLLPASAVVSDLMELARDLRGGKAGRVPPLSYQPQELVAKPLLPLGELVGRAYLRFTLVDRPGVLAQITGVLGEYEIGISLADH